MVARKEEVKIIRKKVRCKCMSMVENRWIHRATEDKSEVIKKERRDDVKVGKHVKKWKGRQVVKKQ